jgi:hypothetical protein
VTGGVVSTCRIHNLSLRISSLVLASLLLSSSYYHGHCHSRSLLLSVVRSNAHSHAEVRLRRIPAVEKTTVQPPVASISILSQTGRLYSCYRPSSFQLHCVALRCSALLLRQPYLAKSYPCWHVPKLFQRRLVVSQTVLISILASTSSYSVI